MHSVSDTSHPWSLGIVKRVNLTISRWPWNVFQDVQNLLCFWQWLKMGRQSQRRILGLGTKSTAAMKFGLHLRSFMGSSYRVSHLSVSPPKLHQGLPLSLSLQVMISVQRDSFVAKTPSVKTGIQKRNVNAGAAMPPSTGIPHTVKVGHLSVRCLELYWWQYVNCCSVSDSMWCRLL